MKDYTYKDQEIKNIRHLINNIPHKIWWNYVSYIFDYTDYYIVLGCDSKAADTQNKTDEAITSAITYINERFVKTEHEELVCENRAIEEAYISRSCLYFTSYKEFSKLKKANQILKVKLIELFTGKVDPLKKVLSTTIGGNMEISCRPGSDEAKKVDKRYINIIDKGLLLKMGDAYLPAYLNMNGYGFPIRNNKYFYEPEELKKDFTVADFIKQ